MKTVLIAALASGAAQAQFEKSADNQYCKEGMDLTTEADCKAGAQALGIPYEVAFPGMNDHRFCIYANDGRGKAYFNSAGAGAAASPPNPQYGSVCKTAAPQAAPAGGTTEWPGCQEQNTVIRNAGEALFANLQGYGATIGCFLDDCMSSDKFVASEMESCAKVCFSVPECEWWVWGTEEGEQKCWFRTKDSGREAGDGWISGSKSCIPPGTTVMPLGNEECWAEGFGYPDCCDAKFGPNGNAQCWDGVFNYDRCCFPKEEL